MTGKPLIKFLLILYSVLEVKALPPETVHLTFISSSKEHSEPDSSVKSYGKDVLKVFTRYSSLPGQNIDSIYGKIAGKAFIQERFNDPFIPKEAFRFFFLTGDFHFQNGIWYQLADGKIDLSKISFTGKEGYFFLCGEKPFLKLSGKGKNTSSNGNPLENFSENFKNFYYIQFNEKHTNLSKSFISFFENYTGARKNSREYSTLLDLINYLGTLKEFPSRKSVQNPFSKTKSILSNTVIAQYTWLNAKVITNVEKVPVYQMTTNRYINPFYTKNFVTYKRDEGKIQRKKKTGYRFMKKIITNQGMWTNRIF